MTEPETKALMKAIAEPIAEKTMQQARFVMDAQLLERGKTFADVEDWIIDLCEDGTTVMAMASLGGQTLTTSWDWPRSERFDWRMITEQFISQAETVH